MFQIINRFPNFSAQIVISCVQFTLGLTSQLLIIFLLVVLVKSSSLRIMDNCFLINLLSWDLLMTISATFNAVVWNLPAFGTDIVLTLCKTITTFGNWVAIGQATGFLMFVSDKAMKIWKPFHHERLLGRKTVVMSLTVNQISACLYIIISDQFYTWNLDTQCTPMNTFSRGFLFAVFSIGVAFVSSLLMLNLKILHVAHQHKKQIMVQTAADPQNREQNKDTRTVAKVFAMMSLFSFLSYLPLTIILLTQSLDVTLSDESVSIIIFVGYFVWMLNAIADPIAILAFRTDVRKAARNIIAHR